MPLRHRYVCLTMVSQVLTNTVLEQVFEVEYLVQGGQCPDCARLAAKNTWRAVVQVRQKVPHKRTFLFLEQLILKNGIQKDTISVKEVKDGLDFFYSSRSHAIKTVEFLASVVPVRTKSSEQLLSMDTHSNTANYKFTYSVEIAPICKDDLVCLPAKVARSLGNIAQLVVCTRVGNSLHLTDPATLQTAELSAHSYWRAPFASLGAVGDLVEFTVLDCEPAGPTRGRFVEADAQVALANAFQATNAGDATMDYEDGGASDGIYHTRTHLGALLQAGDTALGYHLSRRNFNSDDFATLPPGRVPDVVLVKKTYPARRKKNKTRGWRLRSMAKETADDEAGAPSRGVVGRMGGRDQKKVDQDYELFLRDLEEDPEMRGAVNLYKAPSDVNMGAGSGLAGGKTRRKQPAAPQEDTEMDDARTEAGDDEGDFPDVKLDELLEDLDEMTLESTDE
jgi:nonsense-mediated mRNA decay protein 3